jgi:hypothetical protein
MQNFSRIGQKVWKLHGKIQNIMKITNYSFTNSGYRLTVLRADGSGLLLQK